MQYVGLGDLLSGFINRIPTYATQLGRFLLNSFTRFILNPWGFVTVLVGVGLAIDLLDRAFISIVTSLSNGVQLAQQSIANWVNSITPPACGSFDILCYIESGLLRVAKAIISAIFTYIISPLLNFISFILNSVLYVAKIVLYSVARFLCDFMGKYYGVITGAYATYRMFRSIGGRLLNAFIRGRLIQGIFGGVIAPILVYTVTSTIATTLLNFVLSQFGVSCSTLTEPQAPVTKLPTISTTAVQSIGSGVVYGFSVTYGKAVVESVPVAAHYGFVKNTVGTTTLSISESSNYALSVKVAPPTSASMSVNAKYGFGVTPPLYFTVIVNAGLAFTITPQLTVPVSVSDAVAYVFKVLSVGAVDVAISMSSGVTYGVGNFSVKSTVQITGNQITTYYFTLQDYPLAPITAYSPPTPPLTCSNTYSSNQLTVAYCTDQDNSSMAMSSTVTQSYSGVSDSPTSPT
jgi:hypothetical protein